MSNERSDRDIERLLRAANPVPAAPPPPLPVRAAALRERIMSEPAPPRSSRGRMPLRPWWVSVWTPLVAVVVLVAFVAVSIANPAVAPQASAITPRPLEFSNEGEDTVADVISRAQTSLADAEGLERPLRSSVSTGWYYVVDMDATQKSAVISPEVTRLEWNEDLSGSIRTLAGDAYWADGSAETLPEGTPPPGSLLWEMEFGPGEVQSVVTAEPGSTASDMEALLADYGMADAASGFDVVNSIDAALSFWRLTNQQHARMLQIVAASNGVRVLGSTVDRAGRPVFGLSVDLPSATAELHMFISQDTGRVVGFETLTTRADEAFDAGLITSYRMYDVE